MRHGGGEPKREENKTLLKRKGWHAYTRGREGSSVFEFGFSYQTPPPIMVFIGVSLILAISSEMGLGHVDRKPEWITSPLTLSSKRAKMLRKIEWGSWETERLGDQTDHKPCSLKL